MVLTDPIQRRLTETSHSATSVLGVSSGKRSSASLTFIAAQSVAGADHSRRSQSKRRWGIVRHSSTSARS